MKRGLSSEEARRVSEITGAKVLKSSLNPFMYNFALHFKHLFKTPIGL